MGTHRAGGCRTRGAGQAPQAAVAQRHVRRGAGRDYGVVALEVDGEQGISEIQESDQARSGGTRQAGGETPTENVAALRAADLD